ncbi:MAG: TAT-variant-translocated molybdopterin oxidoreductase [Phycisphaerales bacterium]|nr:TAT-variant-translocated molybdopterin oxidoreductase [Phycisphaerales bacterium]
MSSLGTPKGNGQAYWRSLEELSDTPEFRSFMHREFPSGASELLDGTDRRHFLRIMGGSMALAGLGVTGCRRWPEEKIVPYSSRPEGSMPGQVEHYASTLEVGGVASGILVASYDGRPIKIEGNKAHPTGNGGSTAFTQAAILDLYDPDRGRSVIDRLEQPEEPRPSNWKAFDAWSDKHFADLASADGEGLSFLSESTYSPSIERLQRSLRERFPKATWTSYEPLDNVEAAAGLNHAFTGQWRAIHDFTNADVMVSFDCDFLGQHPEELTLSKQWAMGRKPRIVDGHPIMNRVFIAEPTLTITGGSADERYSMTPAAITVLAARVAASITGNTELSKPFESLGIETPQVETIVSNLKSHPGHSAVMAGPRQPRFVHHLCALINESLGNAGKTVSYVKLPSPSMKTATIRELSTRMDNGEVKTLVIVGGNPAYDAPADLDFAERLKAVEQSIHLSDQDNETSQLCSWHLNRANSLEAWGDGRAWDGTYSVCQPLILPLFEGRSSLQMLAGLAGENALDGFDMVRSTEAEITSASADESSFSPRWRALLHDGVLPDSGWPRETPRVNTSQMPDGAVKTAESLSMGGVQAIFAGDYSVYDGRFGNNGWLQELPDPITKLTWDNAVIIGPSHAKSLGLRTGDMVLVKVDGASVKAAVLIETGQADGVITLPLGYGRRFPGRVCYDSGFDFYPLRKTSAMWTTPVTLEKTEGTYVLARTQDHWSMDKVSGRGIEERLPTLYREADVTTWQKDPKFAGSLGHTIHSLSLWDDTLQFDGARFKWGMSIDLSTCTGCGACVVACQAENNIPIVGKDQVRMGREMSWLRIDRYYRFKQDSSGTYEIDDPASVAIQPVACVMCENAPCEQVCPVAATVHDTDGLNVMVYNRCVGTRYCSNNCPYKVRRFNYFDYFRREPLRETGLLQVQPSYYLRRQSGSDPLRRMQFNPEVTVRMRGVMEKCTYCTQRIQAEKIKAKNEWVKKPEAEKAKGIRLRVPDGAIVPACAQTCATDAIVFGDLLDPNSKVSKAHKDLRSYELLGELNIKPRTRYLAKIYNAVEGERYPDSFHGHGGHGHGDHGGHGYGDHGDHGHDDHGDDGHHESNGADH